MCTNVQWGLFSSPDTAEPTPKHVADTVSDLTSVSNAAIAFAVAVLIV